MLCVLLTFSFALFVVYGKTVMHVLNFTLKACWQVHDRKGALWPVGEFLEFLGKRGKNCMEA